MPNVEKHGGEIHRYLIEVDYSSGQFKLAKLKDQKYTINAPIFFVTLPKRKRWMHQIFLSNGQLLIYVTDAVSTSIRYLWGKHVFN